MHHPPSTGSIAAPVLSFREQEVLRHRADGRSTAQIAAAMAVSTNTVRTRWRHVLAKLDVEEWQEAVRRARVMRIL